MLIIFIRGIIVYLIVIFATRAMGKRQLGQLSPSELVITILISNIATLSMENTSLPLLTGIVPILTLVCLDILVSYVCLKSRRIRRIVTGAPKILISNGKLDEHVMCELRLTVDDICAALRNSGVFDITEVQYAIVETTGKISVLQKCDKLPLTQATLNAPPVAEDPPEVVISAGKVLSSRYLSDSKLSDALRSRRLSPKDVLICLSYPDGSIKIIPKDKAGKKGGANS